ncbi:hypothetical protein J7L87_00605, partial [bacterium]|nr:hypothetical protein [bacterium]
SDIFYPSSKLEKIEISDEEFITLLNSLKKFYLSGKIMNRRDLSYYTFEKDTGRHRIMKLLNQVNWVEKLSVLRNYIRKGNTVILTGEDMGIDFLSGMSVDPLSERSYDESVDCACGGEIEFMKDSDILPALEKLTGVENLLGKLKKEGRCVFKIGKGQIILDPISFDNLCSMNGEFEIEYRKWLEEIKKLMKE